MAEDRLPGPPALGAGPGFHHRGVRPAEAAGYSFPSGHTQSITGSLGGIARFTERTWLRAACIAVVLLVAVSRMYLGVHTPADVGVSLAVGTVLVLVLYPLLESTLWFPGRMYAVIGAMLALSLAFVAFVELWTFPADLDAANYAAAVKNAYTLLGAVTGVLAVYALDSRLIRFSTRAPWWGQAVKLIGGLVLVAAVKSALKAPCWLCAAAMRSPTPSGTLPWC